MKNCERYRSPASREAAFRAYCNSKKGDCSDCGLVNNQNNGDDCRFFWLESECPPRKIEKCPYCGNRCHAEICRRDNCGVVKCLNCGYESGHIATLEGAVERHNEICSIIKNGVF